MQEKITEFVESTLLGPEELRESFTKRLIKWSEAYQLYPSEDKIKYLINEMLLVYFSNEIAQKFLDIYFNNVLVSNHKK